MWPNLAQKGLSKSSKCFNRMHRVLEEKHTLKLPPVIPLIIKGRGSKEGIS